MCIEIIFYCNYKFSKKGYGGSGISDPVFPIKNTDPNTDPWELQVSSFSESRNVGLATDAANQVPPNTLY